MKRKMKIAALAAMLAGVVCAMPTKQELTEARQLVSELMAPAMADYKAKTKTAAQVADESVKFAETAKSEAARYVFLRGAISFYVRGGEFGKAADTVEKLKAKVKDVPPEDVANIISGALGRENARKAPRLQSQLQLAQTQIKAAKDKNRLAASLKQVDYEQDRRQYAEALALCGDWKSALAEFAKISGAVGKTVKAEQNGSAKDVELGDFWWGYEPIYAGGKPLFQERAMGYYRKALDGGQLDGLKKTLVEQRLNTPTLPDVDNSVPDNPLPKKISQSVKPVAAKPSSTMRTPSNNVKDKYGLIHRWSFTDDLTDSIGGVKPSKSENAEIENGEVKLKCGYPLEFPAGTVPKMPFTVQAWAHGTLDGVGLEENFVIRIANSQNGNDDSVHWSWTTPVKRWTSRVVALGTEQDVGHGKLLLGGESFLFTITGEKVGGKIRVKCLGVDDRGRIKLSRRAAMEEADAEA